MGDKAFRAMYQGRWNFGVDAVFTRGEIQALRTVMKPDYIQALANLRYEKTDHRDEYRIVPRDLEITRDDIQSLKERAHKIIFAG